MKQPLRIIAITTAVTVCGLFCTGSVSAMPMTDMTTDTEITEESEEQVYYDSDTVDTSWFDYLDPKSEYTISTEAQLRGLASLVNEEQFLWKPNRTESFEDVTFVLSRDITLTDRWKPIGVDEQITFSGTFDGKGHSITGIDVKTSDPYSGLFGHLSGTVRNLSLEGKVNSTSNYCGGVTGYIAKDASVRNCHCNVLVNGRNEVGGIAGESHGSISGCISLGEVVGASMVGGVVGQSRGGNVRNSGNRGLIVSNGAGSFNNGTGGVAGRSVSASTLIGCYNVGDIISSNEATGGVAGYTNSSASSIVNCYSIGSIRIEESQVRIGNTIEPGTASNAAKSDQKPVYAGGLAGYVGSQSLVIKNCYNAGKISGADYAGGIIGKCENELFSATPPAFQNNYYGKGSFDSAIAADRDDKHMKVRGAATEIYGSAFGHLATSLGTAYMDDKAGNYGSKGCPVLTWQEEYQSEDSLAVLKHIDREIQKRLHDANLALDAEGYRKGELFLRFFNLDYIADHTLTESQQMEKPEQKNTATSPGDAERNDNAGRNNDQENATQDDHLSNDDLAALRHIDKDVLKRLRNASLALEKEGCRKGEPFLLFFNPDDITKNTLKEVQQVEKEKEKEKQKKTEQEQ